jgi:hypothetical protein
VRARIATMLVLLAALPLLARADVVPDSATRAALQRRIGRLAKVRVLGAAGETILLKPTVLEDGLRMREPYRPPRPALVVIGELPPPPPPVDFVPWSAIAEVQVARGEPVRGLVAGALFGAGLSAILFFAYERVYQRYGDEAVPVALLGGSSLTVTGAVVGATIGSFTEGWRTVYPAPPSTPPREP